MHNLLTISAIIEILALILWVGGLASLTLVAAPAIFRTVPTREMAGRTFGVILRRFDRLGWGCGVAILLAGALRYAELGAAEAVITLPTEPSAFRTASSEPSPRRT